MENARFYCAAGASRTLPYPLVIPSLNFWGEVAPAQTQQSKGRPPYRRPRQAPDLRTHRRSATHLLRNCKAALTPTPTQSTRSVPALVGASAAVMVAPRAAKGETFKCVVALGGGCAAELAHAGGCRQREPTPLPPRPCTPRRDNSKKKDVRLMNIEAAKAVADAIRTSLGPRGMDKMASCSGGGRSCCVLQVGCKHGPAPPAALPTGCRPASAPGRPPPQGPAGRRCAGWSGRSNRR